MKMLTTIGIAALLLGLVLSVPLRVNALEDEKSVIEGEITEPRRARFSPIFNGLLWAAPGFLLSFLLEGAFFIAGLGMAIFGFPASSLIVFPLLGILLIFLSPFWMILGIVSVLTIIGFPLGFVFICISLLSVAFGIALFVPPIGVALLGILLLFLALIFMFVLPVVWLILSVILAPILFVLGLVEGIANMPYDIGNFIIRLIDAIVPG